MAKQALFKECIPVTGPQCFSILAGKSIEYTGLREASRGGPTPTQGPPIRHFLHPARLKVARKIKNASHKNMNLRNINLDRRQEYRKVPEKFAFLQLEGDEGGTVLDVSEGGLRFKTFAPVRENGPIHFWFSLNLREHIEAWGEVAWINAANKCGGLRFLRLSEEGRAQIREWLSQPALKAAPHEEFLSWGTAKELPASMGVPETDATARFVSKARPRQAASVSATGEAADASTLSPVPQKLEATELVPLVRHLSQMRRQLIVGLLLGTCISGTIAVAAIKYSNYRYQNRGLAKVPVELSAQTSGGAALPTPPINPTTAGSASAGSGNQKKRATGAYAPSILATETGGHPSPRAWEAPASMPAAQAPRQPSLGGNASRQKTSMSAPQLWVLVQAGNSNAAAALAELYIKGDGVPQNCTQARLLLLVASEKRNAVAIKRLAELDKTGCPAN